MLFDVSPETYKGIVNALGDRRFRHPTTRARSNCVVDTARRRLANVLEILCAFGDRHFRTRIRKERSKS